LKKKFSSYKAKDKLTIDNYFAISLFRFSLLNFMKSSNFAEKNDEW